MTIRSATLDAPDLESLIERLHDALPSYFRPLKSPRSLVPSHPVCFDDIVTDHRHTPATATALMNVVLTRLHPSPSRSITTQLSYLAEATLFARLRPDTATAPAYALCTQPLIDFVPLLTPFGVGDLMLRLLSASNLYRTLWTTELLSALIARRGLARTDLDAVRHPSSPHSSLRLPIPRPDAFAPEILDLLLSSPDPWPCVAAVSDLSDSQFSQLLERLDPNHSEDATWIAPHIISSERLATVLSRLPSPLPTHAHWLARVAITEDILDLIIPHLSELSLVQILVGDTTVYGSRRLARFPSSNLVTHLLERHPLSATQVAQELHGIGSDIPTWYLVRLILRMPGLAGAMLELNIYTAFVHDLVTRLSSDPPATCALLTNPAVSLSEALAATKLLIVA